MTNTETFTKYLGLLPDDTNSEVAKLCLDAAESKAKSAGVSFEGENPMRDLFIYGLAGYWFDNRNLTPIGQENGATQKMINAFVLELRYKPRQNSEVREDG